MEECVERGGASRQNKFIMKPTNKAKMFYVKTIMCDHLLLCKQNIENLNFFIQTNVLQNFGMVVCCLKEIIIVVIVSSLRNKTERSHFH